MEPGPVITLHSVDAAKHRRQADKRA